jgi:hypothetical protein
MLSRYMLEWRACTLWLTSRLLSALVSFDSIWHWYAVIRAGLQNGIGIGPS